MKREEQNKMTTEKMGTSVETLLIALGAHSFQDAVSIAQTEEEPVAAARKLTETAFTRGSADNITCIVVKFHHEKLDPKETHQHLEAESQPKETQKNSQAAPWPEESQPTSKPEPEETRQS